LATAQLFVNRLSQTVSKLKGRIDIIFANAGIGEFVPFPKVSKEHFDKLFKVNVATWVVD
jgi:NAD(P)-dependent dehydrogenase (short-subunit alcohol dehydrogenase family)